jgi:acyl-coenzyme A synthetase/AMP-(fatty) acid ligase
MVAVVLPLSVDAVVLLVAGILGDFSVVFLDPEADPGRRAAILAAVAPDVLVDASGARHCGSPDQAVAARQELSPGYVAMSSGSLGGAPKGVLSSWDSVSAFVEHGAAALQLGPHDTWAETSHPSYDMAMTNLLLVLASGARLRLSSALGDRLRPLRHVDRVGATHVRVAPRFIDLAAAERRDAPVGTLRVWASGGDRLYASQVEALFALGVPNVVNTYGTSESLGFASAAVFRAGAEVPAVNGAATIGCGRVGPWRVEIAVVEGAEMLAVRTPHLPGPYLFGEASGGFPSWVAEDVVLTGDTGTSDRSMLFCTGRAGRQVKRHGRFVDLDHVDTALRAHHRVASFTTVSATGELVCLVEAGSEALAVLEKSLPSVLAPDVLPNRLVPVERLPRLGNGKIDHGQAKTLVAQALTDAESESAT